MMKLSKFTLFLAVYIIISASFMQQVWMAWKAILGKNTLSLFFILACLGIICALLYRSIKSGCNIKKMSLICIVWVMGFIFAWRQVYEPEKAHVLEYGVLAWLAMRDLSKDNKNMLKGSLSSFIFILIIGSLDEGFQKLLPYRVFEVKDILTNILSGILGIALFVSAQFRDNLF